MMSTLFCCLHISKPKFKLVQFEQIAMQQQQIRDLMNAPSRVSSSVDVAGRSTTIERHSSALSEAFRKQGIQLPGFLPIIIHYYPKKNH